MRDKLLAFITENPRASFSEVERFFEKNGFDYRGECSIDLREGSNIMLWDGWNREAVGLLLGLVHSGEAVVSPASWVEAVSFGKAFDLPIAKRPQNGYKKLHWLPVVMSAAEVTR